MQLNFQFKTSHVFLNLFLKPIFKLKIKSNFKKYLKTSFIKYD